jgi:hypothetical protein
MRHESPGSAFHQHSQGHSLRRRGGPEPPERDKLRSGSLYVIKTSLLRTTAPSLDNVDTHGRQLSALHHPAGGPLCWVDRLHYRNLA